MVFPCIYAECSKRISWTKVQQHELECPYRTISCPDMDCEAIILCTKIVEHFNEFHKSSIISDIAVRFHKLSPSVDLGLLVHEGVPFFCMFSSNGNVFKISVYSVKSKITHKYTIDLYTLTFQKRKISLSGEAIVLFNDRLHCLRCHSGKCGSTSHKKRSRGNRFEMTTEVDVASIRSILKSETICSKISIEVNKHLQDVIENCDVIRKITECVICKEYMSPPIHFCQSGHIICNTCQNKIPKCPTCLAPFLHARNYAVEELCSNVIIPCQNAICDFVGDLKELHLHEETCEVKNVTEETKMSDKFPFKFG